MVRIPQGFLAKEDAQHVTLEALMKNDVMAVLCCPLAQDCIPGELWLSTSCRGLCCSTEPMLLGYAVPP